jgi:DNA-binding MarR family transcriptional regulator
MNGSQLHRLARRLRELALAVTSEEDEERVSAGELAIVEDVAAHPGAAVGEIAARTGLAQSLVSRTVALMREAGIFVTRPDPTDRRRSLVSIPPEQIVGFRDRAARPLGPELARALPWRTPEERAHAEALLDELAALFTEPRGDRD